MKKKTWWITSACVGVVALAGVAGVTVAGVSAQVEHGSLTHQPGAELPEVSDLLAPATPGAVDTAALRERLGKLSDDPALGTLGAQITDTSTGESILTRRPGEPLRPASSTKVLTASAALLELGPDDTLTTEVVRGQEPGSVVIRAGGDVWLTGEQLDDLARQVGEAAPGTEVNTVSIDTGIWQDTSEPEGWDDGNIDAGFVAPMEPAMINGARLGGATSGDVPRSHTPARDVATALAGRLDASVGEEDAPAGAEVVATTSSPMLSERITEMMKDSDNVMAEAVGHELAVATGRPATFDGAVDATLDVLRRAGVDTTGVSLHDNSGLSDADRIPPALLDALLSRAATGAELRPLLAALPVAGATGTLEERYNGLDGRGWVRAKTGTLTATSALAGVVTGQSGRTYSFALLSNDSEINAARRAMDTLVSALRDA